jgi:DNA-binding XRE family transcriptional regulator
MPQHRAFFEKDLAVLAMQFRKQAGKTRAQAAREMNVSQTSIFNAEESPEQSLLKLRVRMIEAYSRFTVVGGCFFLKRKQPKSVLTGEG